jgi:hypothetical protein
MTQLKNIAVVVGSESVVEQDVTAAAAAAAATTTTTTVASATETSKILPDKQFAKVDAKSAEKGADEIEAVSIEAKKNIAKVDAHSNDKSEDGSEAVSIEADDNDGQAIEDNTPISGGGDLGSATKMIGAGMGSVMGGVGSVGSASFLMMPDVAVPGMGGLDLGDVGLSRLSTDLSGSAPSFSAPSMPDVAGAMPDMGRMNFEMRGFSFGRPPGTPM